MNVTSPLQKKSIDTILFEIEEETQKGMLLKLIRDYQINYGNGSWNENIRLPYKLKNDIHNLLYQYLFYPHDRPFAYIHAILNTENPYLKTF